MDPPSADAPPSGGTSVPLPPLSSKASASATIAPTPVICTLKTGSNKERVPAVKASHPTAGCAIFPLNRLEVGDVWFGETQAQRWDVKPLDGGWEHAFSSFKSLVRYLPEFLFSLLEALRKQSFQDDTPLSWTQWSYYCKNTTPKLYALVTCYRCATPRYLSMRLLNDVGRSLEYFQCDTAGARCGEDSDKILDLYQEQPLIAPTQPPSVSSLAIEAKGFPTYPADSRLPISSSSSPFAPAFSSTLRAREPPQSRPLPHFASPDLLEPQPEPCTWSALKRKHRGRRARNPRSEEDDSDSDQGPDPQMDTLATPQPKNFLHCTLIKRLRKPDPTAQQLEEYWVLKSTKEWRATKHAFIKWVNTNKELRFAGTPNVALFVEWTRNMRTHFKDCDIYNPVCQFEVATTTFTKNARN